MIAIVNSLLSEIDIVKKVNTTLLIELTFYKASLFYRNYIFISISIPGSGSGSGKSLFIRRPKSKAAVTTAPIKPIWEACLGTVSALSFFKSSRA